MQRAKPGDTVRIHYTGTLGDGTVFDSSRGGEPLEFVLGKGQEVAGDAVVLDANHPLAGEDLNFALELVEIR